MVAKPRPYVPLSVIGSVPFRPIGSSHYIPVPYQLSADTAYLPSDMSEEALSKGLMKVTLKVCDFPIVYEQLLEAYFDLRLVPLWSGCKVLSYEEAVSLLTFDKSPGYPDFYTCEDKACALRCSGGDIKQDVLEMLYGAEKWLPFTVTLKDELRTADRVAAHKTRVFTASNIRHLLLGKMLFTDQEARLRASLGQHPVTIGISVPGPGYVAAVRGLARHAPKPRCWGFDIGGCDQTFLLTIARKIRDARKKALPDVFHPAIDFYYNCTYCGEVICCGCIHRALHQKSGQELTGDDTSLYGWGLVGLYVMDTIGCPVNEADRYFQLLQNGDDGAVSFWDDRLSGPGFQDWCAKLGVTIELERREPSLEGQITFLSNSLRERFVPGRGDIVVTAGNLTKLLSSIEWLRKNADFTLEENTLLHWCGLRIGLWPWKQHFDDLEERIDDYLKKIEVTPRIVELLRCRVSSERILQLHLRYEGGFNVFTPEVQCGVRSQFMGAIKYAAGMQLPKGEKQRRAQQSARDRKQGSKPKNKDAHVKAFRQISGNVKSTGPTRSQAGGSTGNQRRNDVTVTAPQVTGVKSFTGFSVKQSPRFRDGIVCESEDHIDYVVQPASVVSGQCLLNWYVSPSDLGGSRLEKYGALYEKFLFEILDFIWVPAVGSAQSGSIGLAYDPDVMDDTPPASVDGVRQYSGYQFNSDANSWIPQQLCCRPTAPDTGYYTNPVTTGPTDDRLAYQGQIYVYASVPSGLAADGVLGRLRMRYRCHFFSPQLENVLIGAELGAASGTSIAAVANADFLGWLNNAGALVSGAAKFIPKLDSNGKYYLDLATGVYKFYNTIKAATNAATSAGAGTVQIDTPTVVLNETPTSAAAPQPWIQQTEDSPGYQVTGDVWSSAGGEFVVGIPRGGGKLYQTYDVGTTITTPGDGQFQMDIERLTNFVPSYAGLFMARYVGAEECANTRDPVIKQKAFSRSTKKKFFRPPQAVGVSTSVAPERERERARGSIPASFAAQFPLSSAAIEAMPGALRPVVTSSAAGGM